MARMSWRKSISGKTAIALILTFLSLMAVIFISLVSIMLVSITKQEKKYVTEHVARAINAIEAEQRNLALTAADWAVWSDSYQFMQDKNNTYVSSNLIVESFQNIRIDTMVFIGTSGDIAFSSLLDKKAGRFIGIPDTLDDYCRNLVKSPATFTQMRGLLMLPEGPLMFATCPILKNDGSGPCQGVLLVGRLIDSEEAALLAGNLKLNLSIGTMDAADKDVLKLFDGKYSSLRVQELSSKRIAGYGVLADAYGKPAVLVSLTTDREMSRIGWIGTKYAVMLMAAACVLCFAALLFALNRLLLRRFGKLCSEIKEISANKAFSRKLTASGKGDELDVVADEINQMLASLERSRAKIIEREDTLRRTNEDLQMEILERERVQNEIKHLAYHDSLTGLPNRIYLTEQLKHGIQLAKRMAKLLAVLFLDLDGFKMINDTMGHASGDILLNEVAKRLMKTVRRSDIIARLGGDEFIIMVENLDDSSAVEHIAQKVLACFAEPFIVSGQECFVTTSIGIAVYPSDGEDAETLLKNADIAMYKAKERGNNQYVLCTYGIKAKVLETMKMANRMFRALERNEFTLHYQPQVSCNNNEIVGVEALIRWNHPDLGLVMPNDFISIAEQTGLIISIGEWVMRSACRQNKAWQDAGLPKIRMGVNLSIKQFQNHNLVGEVQQILKDTNMDPEYLDLEITESIAMREQGSIVSALNALKAMGVHISIDDFGTEYSSMNHLKQLPIDKIKIPMPFVQGIDVSEKDEAITKSIIVLAKSLGLSVLAEGVETKEQYDFLTCRMCDEVQGFFYYKPMPAEEMEKLLRKQV